MNESMDKTLKLKKSASKLDVAQKGAKDSMRLKFTIRPG